MVHYIDDFVFVSDSYEEAEEAIEKLSVALGACLSKKRRMWGQGSA